MRAFSLPVLFCLLLGCAPQKALIDHGAAGRLVWPGPPEEPRIMYQWTLSLVPGTAETLLLGDDGEPGAARFLRPYGIWVDDVRRLFVTDPDGRKVVAVDIPTGDVRIVSRAENEEFLSPIGVAGALGKVYVSDSELKKVYVMDRDGRSLGRLEGDFERPTSLAVDSVRNVLYVADTTSHMIHLYSLDGRRIRTLGTIGAGKGEFNFPTHLWVDREGRLYVTDSLNFRIQIFSPEGIFEGMFGTLGDAYGNLEKPKGVATDSEGNIYVVDSIRDMVKIFNRKGELLLFFGEEGREPGQFWLPSGIFVDREDVIYVTDSYNARIQAFQYLRKARVP